MTAEPKQYPAIECPDWHKENRLVCEACVYQALEAAVAEEAAKKTCVGHERTLCACYECVKDFKAEAAAEERERILNEVNVRATRYVHPDDRWGAGYKSALLELAAAIRKGVSSTLETDNNQECWICNNYWSGLATDKCPKCGSLKRW